MADNASISSPANRSSIFHRGPTFTLDTFSSKEFIVKEFIEALYDSAIPASQRRSNGQQTAATSASSASAQPFDPKPLIRAFEHAKRRLYEVAGDLETKENELSDAVRKAESEHAQSVTSLSKKLNQAIESFQKLDASLDSTTQSSFGFDGSSQGSTGNMAVETGKRLEELQRQRRRALDAHFLIECWDEVSNRGELTLLENLRRSNSGAAKVRCAHIAKQLLRISHRLDADNWDSSSRKPDGSSYTPSPTRGARGGAGGSKGGQPRGRGKNAAPPIPVRNTREIIEKFSETLEQDLLKQFNDFYHKANFEGMRDCAAVLYDFNAGASVIGMFLNQHQFFIDRSQLIAEEVGGDADFWEKLADPDADNPTVEPSLQSLVDEVKVVAQDESSMIKRSFPYYEQVLGKFLQRVFEQSIQQRLEMVLDKASSVSSLAFLRSLQTSRSYISVLVDDLKAHGLTEHPEHISSQTAVVLDQQLEDLFVPYFSGSSYIDKEKTNLEELYTSLMFKFTTYHARRKSASAGFLSSLAKSGSELLSNAKDAYLTRLESDDYTPTQRAMLLRVAGLKEGTDFQKQTETEITEENGNLNPAFAKRMLKWLAEAVGRSLELGASSDTPKDVSVLLGLLLNTMSEGYIEVALEASYEAASSQESYKTEPDFSHLLNLRTAINITHLMMAAINTVLIPLAASSITIRRDMEKRTSVAVARIEEKINLIQQKTVDVALAWVNRLLSGQKKNDFRPKEGDGSFSWLEMLQTPVCSMNFSECLLS